MVFLSCSMLCCWYSLFQDAERECPNGQNAMLLITCKPPSRPVVQKRKRGNFCGATGWRESVPTLRLRPCQEKETGATLGTRFSSLSPARPCFECRGVRRATEAEAASDTSYEAYTVERFKPTVPFVVEEAESVPIGENLKSTHYVLRLKDKSGKTIYFILKRLSLAPTAFPDPLIARGPGSCKHSRPPSHNDCPDLFD
jgi:hypothetical protein